MREEALNIGVNQSVVGILSRPDMGQRAEGSPIVLFFNAGFLHRVGPFRLWVDLSRALTQSGYTSFRFDLNGLGDSTECENASDFSVVAIRNIREVMDELQSRIGAREFVLVGLCSGADYGHPAMVADPRIRGGVWIDAFGYRTPWFHVQRQLQRLLSARRLKNIVQNALRNESRTSDFPDDGVREFPTQAKSQAEIQALLADGRRLFFVYTAGVPDYFNHERQFWGMFPKLKPVASLRYRYFPETDHTFSLVNERREVQDEILRFIVKEPAPIPQPKTP